MWQQKTFVTVLLDSGATHNFIDSRTVTQLHLGTRLLKQPLSALNVDGTLNKAGTITHFCNLTIRTKDHSQILGFYVTNIGSDRMIFGHPWCSVCHARFPDEGGYVWRPGLHRCERHSLRRTLREVRNEEETSTGDN
jgi:hypothetical protein